MAFVTLTGGESIGLGTGNFTVFGTATGAETLILSAGSTIVLDGSFNGGGDILRLAGNAGTFSAIRSGSSIVLTSGTGATATSVTIPVGTVGASVQFADRTANLVFNTTSNNIELGGQVIGTTTVAVTPGTGGGAVAGQSFLLTAGVDSFTGGASDDTFTAVFDGTNGPAAGNTLTATDTLVGGAGTDSLNITATAAGANLLGGANVSGIEVVNVRPTNGAITFDASTAIGLTNVNTNTGTGALTVTNLATGAQAGIIGNGTVVNGALTFGYATTTAAATLNVANGSQAGTNVTVTTAASAATINSVGAANALGNLDLNTGSTIGSLTVNATTKFTGTLLANDFAAEGATLTVTGAGAVNVGNAGIFKTIDASTNTGGLTIEIDTVATSVKGSSGNDVFTTSAITATTAGLADAGAGVDTLIVADVAHVNSATNGARFVNFETIRATGTLQVSRVAGITALEVNGATNNFTDLSAAAAGAVTTLADIGDSTFALTTATGTSDVLAVKFGDGTGAAFDAGALTVNGFETLNLVANGSATNADRTTAIGSFVADSVTAINLTGSGFTITNAATTKAATINASALTGVGTGATATGLTLGGSLVTGSSVTASAFVDTITIGAAGTSYNLGAGNDSITTTGTLVAAQGNTIIAGAGTDTVTITGGATLVDAAFQNITEVEAFTFTGNNAVSVTSGGFFNTNYSANGISLTATGLTDTAGTVDLTTFTGKATVNFGGAAGTGNQTVTTGSGNDVITVSGAAAQLTVVSGAGTDTITITGTAATTLASANGGAGVDSITFSADIANAAAASRIVATYAIGDSTAAGFDTVTGFDLGTAGLFASTLNLDGTPTVAANFTGSTVAGFSSAELTATNVNGLITFSGSAAAGLTVAQRIAAVDSLINTDNATAIFQVGSNTYVYHDSVGAAADTVILLAGVSATSLITTNAQTAGAIFIA